MLLKHAANKGTSENVLRSDKLRIVFVKSIMIVSLKKYRRQRKMDELLITNSFNISKKTKHHTIKNQINPTLNRNKPGLLRMKVKSMLVVVFVYKKGTNDCFS